MKTSNDESAYERMVRLVRVLAGDRCEFGGEPCYGCRSCFAKETVRLLEAETDKAVVVREPVHEDPFPETIVHMHLDGTSRKYIPVDGAELREKFAALTAERDRARKSLRELTHWSAGTVEYDAAKRTALQVLADAYLTPAKPLAMVPRGHCGRCDRCGWELTLSSLGCSLGNCSLRPVPPRRDACAGCGAHFETTPETP